MSYEGEEEQSKVKRNQVRREKTSDGWKLLEEDFNRWSKDLKIQELKDSKVQEWKIQRFKDSKIQISKDAKI